MFQNKTWACSQGLSPEPPHHATFALTKVQGKMGKPKESVQGPDVGGAGELGGFISHLSLWPLNLGSLICTMGT